MLNNLPKNKLLLFLVGFLISALLTHSIFQFQFPKVDAFFNDLHLSIFKRKEVSSHLKLIHLTPDTDDIMYFSKFSLHTHKKIIDSLFANGAKNVFYAIDPQQLQTNEQDFSLEEFIGYSRKFDNLYFVIPSTFSNIRASIFNHPQLSQLNIIETAEGTDMISGASDWVVRRIMLGYEEKVLPLNKILNYDVKTLAGQFIRNELPCVKARFASKDSYKSLKITNSTGLDLIDQNFARDSWVFVGLNSKFDLFDFRKIPHDHSPYAMNYNEALANVYDTLIQKDYPKVPTQIFNLIWTFLNLLLFLFIAIRLSAKKLFIASFIQQALVIVIPISVFAVSSWQLDTARPFLILFLLQYIAIPFVFVKLARQNDKDILNAKEEKSKAINKAKITAKSAKADLGFRIATQVAHDIKSPVMALETLKMISKSQLKPEAFRLLENSINRINNIADSLLKKFKSGSFETVNESLSTDIIFVIKELISTYKQTHANIKIHLQTEPESILIPIDQTEFERSLTNILNNAIDAMNFSGDIHIQISDSVDFAQIQIRDSGKGVPPEIKDKLFESGFSHGKTSGTGIGLSQAKEALQKSGGDINLISSKPGETIFKLLLVKSNLRQFEIRVAKNIILIEDNLETQNVWKKILKLYDLNFICHSSYKSYIDDMRSKQFNPFKNEKFTIISDLIFDGEYETGFDVIQVTNEECRTYLENSYICTTLSSNEDIVQVSKELGAEVFGKKNLDKIKLRKI